MIDMNDKGIILAVPDNDLGNYKQEISRRPQIFQMILFNGSFEVIHTAKGKKKDRICPCIVVPMRDAEELCKREAQSTGSFMTVCVVSSLEMRILKEKRDLYTYILENRGARETVSLLADFWKYRAAGGMLSKRLISSYISHKLLILSGGNDNCVGPSSYDLALGDEYYYGGRLYTLNEKQPFLQIDPYDYAIVSSAEIVNMPRDISGRFDISVSLFCQGIIMSNGTQVDPGFCGKLFCLLFNTSNEPVYLKRGAHFVTMEFCKLLEETEPYDGKYNYQTSIVPYIPPNALQGGINELKQEIDKMKKENDRLQSVFLGILSLVIALIALLVTIQ